MRFKLWLEVNEMVMPELFEKVKQLSSEYSGVHFSKSDQLSFNLNPNHFDPIGIYVFPKKYLLDGGLSKNTMFASFPYAFLIEPTNQAKILNLDMDYPTAEFLLEKMGIDKNLLYDKEVYHKSRGGDKPGHRFWGSLEHYRNIPRLWKNLGRNISWNTLFAKTGYNALYDPGLNIIHSNEPAQVIYLDHKAYRVVDVVRNTNKHSLLLNFASYFPDFRINKRRSSWSRDEYVIKLEKDGIEITTWTSKNDPNRISIKVYGYGERYSSKEWVMQINSREDMEKAVDEVKSYMDKSEKTPAFFSDENYKFMFDVSKSYNLKIDPEYPGVMSKKYRNDTSFELKYAPSTNKATLIVQRNDYARYFFYYETEVRGVEETIQELFSGLKDGLEEKQSGIALMALDFVKFLEKRVFTKRNSNLPRENNPRVVV